MTHTLPARRSSDLSMRPVVGSGGDPHPPANDQSVRGNVAEFHTQPTTRGVRVLACTGSATANCAARSADNWCRSIGWNGSAREHMETVQGRVYLADVQRSEERRVGKECVSTCRSRWSEYHYKKKNYNNMTIRKHQDENVN